MIGVLSYMVESVRLNGEVLGYMLGIEFHGGSFGLSGGVLGYVVGVLGYMVECWVTWWYCLVASW